MIKKLVIFFTLLVVCTPIFSQKANADTVSSKIKISMEAGMDGKVLEGKGFPLNITIDNAGEDFKGDLLIPFSPTYEISGNKMLSIDIPANSSKTYTLTVPGISVDNMNMEIELFKGSWKDQQKVTFSGTKTIKASLISDQYILGILSDDYDQLRELRSLPSNSVLTMEMTEDSIADNKEGLEVISFLLVDQFSLTELREEQQQAILDWVKDGGVLVVGGQSNSKQVFGLLSNSMPLELGEKASVSIQSMVGGKEDQSVANIPAFKSTLTDGAEELAVSNNTPIIAKSTIGNGVIIETAFALSENDLTKWNGYEAWFEQLILSQNSQVLLNQSYGMSLLNELYYSFAESNEYFESANFSIGMLILILTIYFILIVPGLYFVLKKKDKREYAWWIIPSFAIILSFGMFLLGAKDRIGQSQMNEMGIYLNENNYLSGYQANTIFSNNSGEYTLSYAKQNYSPFPYVGYTNTSKESIMVEKAKEEEITFTDVEYWSNRTMFGQSAIEVDGSFENKWKVSDNKITGTIQNNYPYDFSDVYIWTGNEKLQIGNLKAGESKTINLTRKNKYFSAPTGGTQGYYAYDYTGKDIKEFRSKVVESTVLNSIFWGSNPINSPVIVGMTENEIVPVSIVDKEVKKYNTNLIMQPINISNNFPGKVTWNDEILTKDVSIIQGSIYSKNFSYSELIIDDGEYLYKISIPDSYDANKLKLNDLSISNINNTGAMYSIYNNKTKEYEELTSSFSADEKELPNYLLNNKQIELKIDKKGNGDPYTQLPSITFKGEIGQ